MPDNKQQWKEYKRKLRHYINDLKGLEDAIEDYIDSMDQDGETTLSTPPPPENPPPPPNPE